MTRQLFAVLIVLAAAAPTPSSDWLDAVKRAQAPSPRPRVVVTANPRVARAPAAVQATGRLLDPQRELACPTFTWVWGDDSESSWQPYCDPYQLQEETPQLWALWTLKPHVYRRPGRYELRLKVTAGDRTYQASVRVVVLGPGLVADGGSR